MPARLQGSDVVAEERRVHGSETSHAAGHTFQLRSRWDIFKMRGHRRYSNYKSAVGLIGSDDVQVNAEKLAFHEFCDVVCGVFFKFLKDRAATHRGDGRQSTRTSGRPGDAASGASRQQGWARAYIGEMARGGRHG